MKKSALIPIALLLLSQLVLAQDFTDRVYVVSPFPSPEAFNPDECDAAYVFGINPDIRARFDLYSLHTKKTNGAVLNEKVKKVGEILTCQDWHNWSWSNNNVPIYWEATLDGMELVAVGSGWVPGYGLVPGGGMVLNPLYQYSFLVNIGANIIGGVPAGVGGTITSNVVLDYTPDQSSDYPTEGIQVFRVYLPIAD